MKVTLDIKALIIGFLAGAFLMLVLGARGAGSYVSFGLSIPSGGSALVKSENNRAYLVDGATGRAIPVTFAAESKSKIRLE